MSVMSLRALFRSRIRSLPSRFHFTVQSKSKQHKCQHIFEIRRQSLSPRRPRNPRIIEFLTIISRGLSETAPRHGNGMPDHIKKQLLKEIHALEHELAHELPAEIKK